MLLHKCHVSLSVVVTDNCFLQSARNRFHFSCLLPDWWNGKLPVLPDNILKNHIKTLYVRDLDARMRLSFWVMPGLSVIPGFFRMSVNYADYLWESADRRCCSVLYKIDKMPWFACSLHRDSRGQSSLKSCWMCICWGVSAGQPVFPACHEPLPEHCFQSLRSGSCKVFLREQLQLNLTYSTGESEKWLRRNWMEL